MRTRLTPRVAVSRYLPTLLLGWLFLLFLTACGGTFEVDIERAATPDQPATSGDLTPSSQQPGIPIPTPAAPLPGLIYRTDDGLWKTGAVGQATQIFDRASAKVSPDGAYALYLEKDAGEAGRGGSSDLWLADLTTGERRNLTRTPKRAEASFRWWPARPDLVLFSSRPREIAPGPGVTGFLAVVGIDGNGYRILDDQNHTGGLPAPSPNGQTIAYGSGSTGWLYRWETGPEVFDPADYGLPSYRDAQIGSPSWSPDGGKLAWIVSGAFAADRSPQMGVGLFDLETRTAQILHLHEPAFGDGWPAAPVWSPDGKWLAFTAWDQDPDVAGVWVVRADGQQEEEYQSLFTEYHLGGSHPVWISDGRWLAFRRTLDDGGTSSWVAQVGTWGLIRLALPPDAYVVDWISPSLSYGPPRPVVQPFSVQREAVSQHLMHADLTIINGVYGVLTDRDVQQTIASLGRAEPANGRRKGWDSNPRWPQGPQRFSRPSRSSTPAPFRVDSDVLQGDCQIPASGLDLAIQAEQNRIA
jgi:Tol biopolymer transport system component